MSEVAHATTSLLQASSEEPPHPGRHLVPGLPVDRKGVLIPIASGEVPMLPQAPFLHKKPVERTSELRNAEFASFRVELAEVPRGEDVFKEERDALEEQRRAVTEVELHRRKVCEPMPEVGVIGTHKP